MRDFKKLDIWHEAHQLVLKVYKETHNFPKEEVYGLTSQLRRSVVSIPNNIAEGCGRNSKKEFYNFLNISMGSSSEVEYSLLLAHDLNYLQNDYFELNRLLIKLRKMLNIFMQQIQQDIATGGKLLSAKG
ncbi:MAG: four helix bundle protein [Candidatus Cloacimonetes bacterium]|nr:four helix bundle protein [Candidatus Cloacimonadota bacterium]